MRNRPAVYRPSNKDLEVLGCRGCQIDISWDLANMCKRTIESITIEDVRVKDLEKGICTVVVEYTMRHGFSSWRGAMECRIGSLPQAPKTEYSCVIMDFDPVRHVPANTLERAYASIIKDGVKGYRARPKAPEDVPIDMLACRIGSMAGYKRHIVTENPADRDMALFAENEVLAIDRRGILV